MKIYRSIVPLLLFFGGANLYGVPGGVNGFNESDCSGLNSVWAPNLEALERRNKRNGWDFKGFTYENDERQTCHEYTQSRTSPTPIPNFPDNSGGSIVNIPPVNVPFPLKVIHGNVLTESAHAYLLSFWKGLVENETVIQDWVGMFDTTWSNKTEAKWNIKDHPPKGKTALGWFDPKKKPPEIDIFGSRIIEKANEVGIPPEHLVIQVQLEEHIHSIQNKQLNDREDRKWNVSDTYAFELEAKKLIQEIIWPQIFGKAPPLLFNFLNHPDADYEANRKKFNELHPRRNSLDKNEQKIYDKLKDYFEGLKTKVKQDFAYNIDYNKKKDKDGETEEAE